MSPADAIASLGLEVSATFIPFSLSRSKDESRKTLNWSVTLHRSGRDVLTTPYSAGIAHCPGYKQKPPAGWNRPARMWPELVSGWECERGVAARYLGGDFSPARLPTPEGMKQIPIMPDSVDVIYSLVSDSSVIDAGGFDEWASEYGYDTDSRKAESIYRACLDTALKLRAAIGDAGMETLRLAFQDY